MYLSLIILCPRFEATHLRSLFVDPGFRSVEAVQATWRHVTEAVQRAGVFTRCHDELSS